MISFGKNHPKYLLTERLDLCSLLPQKSTLDLWLFFEFVFSSKWCIFFSFLFFRLFFRCYLENLHHYLSTISLRHMEIIWSWPTLKYKLIQIHERNCYFSSKGDNCAMWNHCVSKFKDNRYWLYVKISVINRWIWSENLKGLSIKSEWIFR